VSASFDVAGVPGRAGPDGAGGARYLGPDADSWPGFFRARVADDGWSLWSVPPDSGVATINRGFRPNETRWHRRRDAPLP